MYRIGVEDLEAPAGSDHSASEHGTRWVTVEATAQGGIRASHTAAEEPCRGARSTLQAPKLLQAVRGRCQTSGASQPSAHHSSPSLAIWRFAWLRTVTRRLDRVWTLRAASTNSRDLQENGGEGEQGRT